uniref:Uncharacterized protein n=1 Tax=Chelydra serpentina TaxID=8475 RepID=A0A8C3SFU4_CHESE
MAEGWPWSSRPGAACPRRAVSMCESLDLRGDPAVQAALTAARQQQRRPKSLCTVGNGLGPGALLPPAPPARARSGLLDFFRLRSPRRREEGGLALPLSPGGPHGAQRLRPASMTCLPSGQPPPAAEASGFLRGSSLWGSSLRGSGRWSIFRGSGRSSPGPRRNFSSLRKSFSFRLRRGQELRRSESGGLLRPPRLRTKSEGDAGSLHTCPSKRDLLYPELGRAGAKPCSGTGQAGSLWKLLTGRFRRRAPPLPLSPSWARRSPDPFVLTPSAHSFVNSQEWTLSRSVPELKVGIVGNLSSGKSALVHRYLTGTYVQEESPEGKGLSPSWGWPQAELGAGQDGDPPARLFSGHCQPHSCPQSPAHLAAFRGVSAWR